MKKRFFAIFLEIFLCAVMLFGQTIPSKKTKSGILTVTPKSDGLLLKAEFTEDWQHFTFYIRDITKNEWQQPVTAEAKIIKKGKKSSCEILYPFTAKNGIYKIWYSHMGNKDNEWADWTEETNKSLKIMATGGAGAYNIVCQDGQYLSPRRGLFFNLFIEELPPELATSRRLKIRAERDYRWQGGEQYFETYQVGNYVWFPEDEENEFIKVLKGSDKIFLTADYIINYNGIDYAQNFFGNWAAWDMQNNCEIPDSNWFTDYEALDQSVAKLPRVEIESTENDGDPNFVAAPVAAHVKEQAKEWNAPYVNSPDPWYENCKITVFDAQGNKTDVNETAGQVKVRGNYTTTYDKKSLRIKFDKKQDMLGLNVNVKGKANKYKNWVLLSCYKDASLLRDAAALKMYRTMFPEYYASSGEPVEVFVNGIYWGVYLLAEQQEIKEGRIEIAEAEKDYKGTDIGYLIEFDSYSYTEAPNEQFTIDYSMGSFLNKLYDYDGKSVAYLQDGYTIKSDVYDAAQKRFIQDYMNKLWKVCYEASYNHKYYRFTENYSLEEYEPKGANGDEKSKNCVSEVVDIKSLADMYIFNELICDPDLYLTSFFMDIDFSAGKKPLLRFEAPWDFDSTLGNKNFCVQETSSENITGKKDMFAGACQTDVNCNDLRCHVNPWMVIFIRSGWFQELVKSEWKSAKAKNPQKIADAYITEKTTARLEYNRARWGDPSDIFELCQPSREAAIDSQKASAAYLKNWLSERFIAVDAIIQGLSQK